MLTITLMLCFLASGAYGGSLCPPRENIYPCSCYNIPQGKKLSHTTVYCHHLHSTDSLNTIFSSLRQMQIDAFHLYDSFWDVQKLEKGGEDKRVLPVDWLTLLKIKEIEIVDTTLSSCFACPSKLNCKNTVTTRFTAINSSSHEKFCSFCDTGRGNKYSWTGCMNKLRHFHFSHGKLTHLDANIFFTKMSDLTILNFTNNAISTVAPNTFKNLLRLKILDLSHNNIEYFEGIFSNQMNLEYLDLSWNSIQTLGEKSFFSFLPYLKTLKADNNLIENLEENQWKDVPRSLVNIDLGENPLNCDCGITWINSTFHINVVLTGRCSTPPEYENSLLRKASRFLTQRCEGSSIGTRFRPRSTTPIAG